MSKHTAEPWSDGWGMDVHAVPAGVPNDVDDTRVVRVATTFCTDGAGRPRTWDARRIVQCVNGMTGIDDPAQFVQDVRDLLAAWNEGMALGAALEKVQAHIPETA